MWLMKHSPSLFIDLYELTMAHSFIHVHESQEQAFRNYADAYGENSILLVDTYDSVEGIKQAAALAKQLYEHKNVKIAGIRIDSGDLDEFKIEDLQRQSAQIDSFGIGPNFAVSRSAPAIEIVYKIVQYGDRGVLKTPPGKETHPCRKTITRIRDEYYKQDIVSPWQAQPNDLLKPFENADPMPAIQQRLAAELALLEDPVKAIRDPQRYPVELAVQ